MPRPHFPHSMHDLVHAVDGPLGLVVGDLPDGSIWVLQRQRKAPGYLLRHYADASRSRLLAEEQVQEREAALNRMSEHIGLGERIGGR